MGQDQNRWVEQEQQHEAEVLRRALRKIGNIKDGYGRWHGAGGGIAITLMVDPNDHDEVLAALKKSMP